MSNNKGFSLVELVIIVAIVGILAAIATPSIMEWMPNIRFRGASQELFGHMQQAKMEAVKRSANVVVRFNTVACPGFPNPNAVPDPGGGYTIFADDGAGGGVAKNNTQDGAEATLMQQTMPRNVALCNQTFPGGWTGFQSTGLPVANNVGGVTINNDRGRSATMTMTFAGGVRIQ